MEKSKEGYGLYKSIFMAYTILVLHVLLIGGIGVMAILLRGVADNLAWIFWGSTAALGASGYLFYYKMRVERRNLDELLHSPLFNGRNIEISFMGGLATLKIGRPPCLPLENVTAAPQLTASPDLLVERSRELRAVAQLLTDGLISRQEFETVKERMLGA